MKTILFSLLSLVVACNVGNLEKANFELQADSFSKKTNFELQVDSLKQTIPTVTGSLVFAFSEFSENVWDWKKSQTFLEIDSSMWFDYFNKPEQLGTYRYGYQTNYYLKIFDFQDSFFNLVTIQYIHNGNLCYMYFVQFDRHGNRKKTHILASIRKSPDEYEEVYSSIQGNEITTYTYYNDDGVIKRDTTVILW
jgi:hypothetical protein